jgi:branched-chain amino acid transport system ATP-binding protein
VSAERDDETPAPAAGLLAVDDVQAFYGLAHVLQGVSLALPAGELVALLGRNGAGKTTTLRAIMGLVDVRGGSIRCDGQELVGMPTERVAALGIGYVPEDRRMFPGLTVRENFRLAALGSRHEGGAAAATDRALEVFPALKRHLDLDASRLSGGQQQMVAIGRALICGTRLLLVDEPTQGLAPNIAAEIGRTLRAIADEGVGVLLVEQSSKMALDLADRVYALDQGVIAAASEIAEVREHPEIIERYLKL